jgi:hypothetical protein
MGSKLRTASWILLTVVGSIVLLVSFISANLGYRWDYLHPGLLRIRRRLRAELS